MSLLSTRSFFVFLIQAPTRPYSPGCMLLSDGVPPPVLYVASSVLHMLSSCGFLNWSFLLQIMVCALVVCAGAHDLQFVIPYPGLSLPVSDKRGGPHTRGPPVSLAVPPAGPSRACSTGLNYYCSISRTTPPSWVLLNLCTSFIHLTSPLRVTCSVASTHAVSTGLGHKSSTGRLFSKKSASPLLVLLRFAGCYARSGARLCRTPLGDRHMTSTTPA